MDSTSRQLPGRVKESYTTGARSLASRAVTKLAATRVTPNALTATGVSLCLAAAVIVPFENRDKLLFYWLGAAVFVVGSVLDILDGALARAGGKTTPFGAFLDSTTDRVGEGAMLAAIALVFARAGNDTAVVFTVAATAGSFLVPYARAKAEALGLRGAVGLGSRAERVVLITAGLVFAPWGGLQWAIIVLAVTAWLTVLQRILYVRKQLLERPYQVPVVRPLHPERERPVPGTEKNERPYQVPVVRPVLPERERPVPGTGEK